MTDNLIPNDRQLDRPVTVRRHPVDWEGEDFDVVTARRAQHWERRLSRGLWFLNPRYSVHATEPTPEFFRKVQEVQGSWLRTCRRWMHNRGLRREVRKLDRQGRQAAFVDIELMKTGGTRFRLPPKVIPLSTLTDAERQEVIQGGQLAKQAAFSGLMFIDGAPIPSRTWQEQADRLLASSPPSTVTQTHRHLDQATLQTTGNLQPLKQLAQSALQAHLDLNPKQAAFVTPHLTLSAPTATPVFYRRAEHAQAQWCIILKRILGNGNSRRARRSADPATYALVFGGVLFVDGQLHWPGCWPNQATKPSILKRSPFQTTTVPLNFLGLILSETGKVPVEPNFQSTHSMMELPADPMELNKYFETLLASTGP